MAKKKQFSVPYPPSWQNMFFDWVAKLPIPKLLVFVLIFLGFFLLDHLIPWLEGKLLLGELDAGQLPFHIWIVVAVIALDYFHAYSETAIAKFRPALKINETEYKKLSYRFTHLSARTGWFLTLVSIPLAIVLVSTPGFLPPYLRSGWSRIPVYFSGALQGALFLALMVYLYRTLRMIRQLYDRVESVNLFHLEPIYALSGFTVRVGILCILASTFGYFTTSVGWFLVFTVSIWTVLAIASFVWPLGGVHAKLEKEKERANGENDRRLDRGYKELHQRMDQKKTAGLGDFRSGLSAMLDLRQELKKISTWPWDTATLRTFITALFVPLSVWLIQQVLLRTVAK